MNIFFETCRIWAHSFNSHKAVAIEDQILHQSWLGRFFLREIFVSFLFRSFLLLNQPTFLNSVIQNIGKRSAFPWPQSQACIGIVFAFETHARQGTGRGWWSTTSSRRNIANWRSGAAKASSCGCANPYQPSILLGRFESQTRHTKLPNIHGITVSLPP